MANTHLLPDTMHEVMAREGDLLAPAILASTLTAPGSGLTLPAFGTYGYVRNGSPTRLVYVNQAAAPVTLTGSDGPYWLALMHDTHSAVAGWTRQPGTHYAWRASTPQPADPPGGLVMAAMTVAGGTISAVDATLTMPHTKVAYGGPTGTLAFDSAFTFNATTKVTAGHQFLVPQHAGDNAVAFHTHLVVAGGTNRWAVYAGGDAPSSFGGPVRWLNYATGLSLRLGDHTPPGYTLDVDGDAVLRGATGIGALPVPAVYALNCDSANFTSVQSTSLTVNGPTRFNGLVGISYAPDPSYWLRVPNIYTDALRATSANVDGSIAIAGGATVNGDLYATTGAFGVGKQVGYYLTGYNLYVSTNSQFIGPAQCFNTLAVYRAPEAGYWLTAESAYFNAATVGGALGVTGTLNANTSIQSPSITATNLSVTNIAAVFCAPQSGYYFSAQNIYCNGGLNVGGATSITNTLYVANNVGIGVGSLAGWHLTLAGTGAQKVGGGPWADYSRRAWKRNIAPIPDALGLLLAQQGRVFEWDEATHAALLPGPRYGLVAEEVTLPQWHTGPDGDAIAANGAEALFIEAFRQIVQRLEALEAR